MKHILFFGFGFSARALAGRLDRSEWKLTGTSRSDEGVSEIEAQGVTGVRFDQLRTIPTDVTHIVSSIPPTPEDPVIQKFDEQLARRTFDWVAYLSTTGVYGDHGGGWVDETTALTPNIDRAKRRVIAEAQWQALGLPLHIFRLAGIYGPGRNQLESVRAGTAQRIIKPNQIFSRIHVEDIAGVLQASMAQPHPGAIYNAADDEPCPPQEVIAFAAGLLGVPPPSEVAFEDAKLSSMAKSFYADSKRVSNARVKSELGYRFMYPNYREGLRSLV